MKNRSILVVVVLFVLILIAIPLARIVAYARDDSRAELEEIASTSRTHVYEWGITRSADPTSPTVAVGQQIRATNKVKVGIIGQGDSDRAVSGDVKVDECVSVSDTDMGDIGEVCAGPIPITFEYSVLIGPYEACGRYEHENIASFVTNDTGTIGTASWTIEVNVPCDGD